MSLTTEVQLFQRAKPGWPVALRDPTLMRVTLSMAATFAALRPVPYDNQLRQEGWKLKGEAIQAVNSIISTGQIPENVLAAIAILAATAVSICWMIYASIFLGASCPPVTSMLTLF